MEIKFKMKPKLLMKISFVLHYIFAEDTIARYPAPSELCFDIFATIQSVYITDTMRRHDDSIKFDLKIRFYFDFYFHYTIRKDY